MEKIVKEFLHEKIVSLIYEGYSVYEIAGLLKAHPKLIIKVIGKSSALLKLESNNRNFILKINANYPNPLMADSEFRKYNIITGYKGKVLFTGKYPDTLIKWEEKLGGSDKSELEEKKQNQWSLPEKSETPGFEEDKSKSEAEESDKDVFSLPGVREPETIEGEIISDYLDGISLRSLSIKHQVRKISLEKLLEDHNLPGKITRTMVKERIKKVYGNGASRLELEKRFAHIGTYVLNSLLRQTPKQREKKTFVKEEKSEKVKQKNKINSENKAFILEDYRRGMAAEKIAGKMNIALKEVIKLLHDSGDYRCYYELNKKDIRERNSAIAEYYKKGWSKDMLRIEFRLKHKALVKILRAKGFAISFYEWKHKRKPLKADLVSEYFRKGHTIFDIAERLVMLPERVEYLLRKGGLLEEGEETV